MPFGVLWIYILGGSIGGGSAVGRLGWGDETCEVIP